MRISSRLRKTLPLQIWAFVPKYVKLSRRWVTQTPLKSRRNLSLSHSRVETSLVWQRQDLVRQLPSPFLSSSHFWRTHSPSMPVLCHLLVSFASRLLSSLRRLELWLAWELLFLSVVLTWSLKQLLCQRNPISWLEHQAEWLIILRIPKGSTWEGLNI